MHVQGILHDYSIPSVHPKPSVITVDLDSTIADTRHRWHMVKDCETPNWLEFALACSNDTPANIDFLRSIAYLGDFIFVSSRPEGSRSVTLKWLNNLNLSFAALVLDDEEIGLEEFKVKALRQISETYEVLLHIDDNDLVRDAIEKELGIRTLKMVAYDD